jgi:hypothetical protein
MTAPFTAEVVRYLADCTEHAQLLSRAHHPTEDGAVKLIWHCGQDQADQIRAAFRAAAANSGRRAALRPRRRTAVQDAHLIPAGARED